MKNQYFGDINDYKKYSLLRIINGHGQIKTVVCWLLTEDDNGSDGNHIKYLEQPERWRHYDPVLFDYLKEHVSGSGVRHINIIQQSNILKNCDFYSNILYDDINLRDKYFKDFFKFVKNADLIFFDPDNGLEVKSISPGKKSSSKYIYWNEIKTFYDAGYSILIYQHFPRKERKTFIQDKINHFKDIAPTQGIFSYYTRHVVFFLITQEKHEEIFIDNNANLLNTWGGIISISEYRPSMDQ